MQQIPFFEMFTSLPLSRDVRASLDGAYLTAVEVEKQNRIMRLALTVPAGLGEKKDELAAAVAAALRIEERRHLSDGRRPLPCRLRKKAGGRRGDYGRPH